MSSQDLADKFAKLRLQPSQKQISKKSKKKQKRADKRRSTQNISSKEDKCAKSSGSHSHAHDNEVVHPALPLALYDQIKQAADLMNRPGWRNEGKDLFDLVVIEGRIRALSRILRVYLSTDWKYERENANSLIFGYVKIFRLDGMPHII